AGLSCPRSGRRSSRGTWPTSWWPRPPCPSSTASSNRWPSEGDRSMKVVVAGAGNVGRHMAADLAERGHDVTLIEQMPEALSRARDELPDSVEVILGDACEPYVLEEAKLAQADVIVAATGDDEDNLVVSLLAKQEYAVPRVVARVNHPSNEWMFTEQWGVDAAVSPPHILTALVEEAVTVGDVVRLMKLD